MSEKRNKISSPEILRPEIRSGYPADALQIFEIQRKTWAATYSNKESGITRKDIEAWFDKNREQRIEGWRERLEQGRPANCAWVATVKGEIVGFCSAHRNIAENQIGSLYVLPRYQNAGIGVALIKEALRWLGDEQPVSLGVVTYNEKAINFYKKNGFREGPILDHDKCLTLPGGKIIPEMKMIKPILET